MKTYQIDVYEFDGHLSGVQCSLTHKGFEVAISDGDTVADALRMLADQFDSGDIGRAVEKSSDEQ